MTRTLSAIEHESSLPVVLSSLAGISERAADRFAVYVADHTASPRTGETDRQFLLSLETHLGVLRGFAETSATFRNSPHLLIRELKNGGRTLPDSFRIGFTAFCTAFHLDSRSFDGWYPGHFQAAGVAETTRGFFAVRDDATETNCVEIHEKRHLLLDAGIPGSRTYPSAIEAEVLAYIGGILDREVPSAKRLENLNRSLDSIDPDEMIGRLRNEIVAEYPNLRATMAPWRYVKLDHGLDLGGTFEPEMRRIGYSLTKLAQHPRLSQTEMEKESLEWDPSSAEPLPKETIEGLRQLQTRLENLAQQTRGATALVMERTMLGVIRSREIDRTLGGTDASTAVEALIFLLDPSEYGEIERYLERHYKRLVPEAFKPLLVVREVAPSPRSISDLIRQFEDLDADDRARIERMLRRTHYIVDFAGETGTGRIEDARAYHETVDQLDRLLGLEGKGTTNLMQQYFGWRILQMVKGGEATELPAFLDSLTDREREIASAGLRMAITEPWVGPTYREPFEGRHFYDVLIDASFHLAGPENDDSRRAFDTVLDRLDARDAIAEVNRLTGLPERGDTVPYEYLLDQYLRLPLEEQMAVRKTF